MIKGRCSVYLPVRDVRAWPAVRHIWRASGYPCLTPGSFVGIP